MSSKQSLDHISLAAFRNASPLDLGPVSFVDWAFGRGTKQSLHSRYVSMAAEAASSVDSDLKAIGERMLKLWVEEKPALKIFWEETVPLKKLQLPRKTLPSCRGLLVDINYAKRSQNLSTSRTPLLAEALRHLYRNADLWTLESQVEVLAVWTANMQRPEAPLRRAINPIYDEDVTQWGL
ncbi:hypothetical protein DFQ26_009682, partial [Actinomortierella ambigua]